ncbi:MAG: hypothetical protein K8F27_04245 [Sulfuricellaceae bacterium]|nr:hypothetical protein [Sulfuricellaceae bacterium]
MKNSQLSALILSLLLSAGCVSVFADDGVTTGTTTTGTTTTGTTTTGTTPPSTVAACQTKVDDGTDCVESETETDSADVNKVVNNLLGTTPGAANGAQVSGQGTGTMTVTLPDGTKVDVAAVGKTQHLRHPGAGTTTAEDGEGHLKMVSTDGTELTLEPSVHNAAELKDKLEKAGYTNVTVTGTQIEATDANGNVVSLSPDMTVGAGTPTGTASKDVTVSGTGVNVVYSDGTSQSNHGTPLSLAELRTSTQALGIPTVNIQSDGTLLTTINGQQYKFKMSPTLTKSTTSKPGIRTENGKIIMQYQDGLEQEITQAQ